MQMTFVFLFFGVSWDYMQIKVTQKFKKVIAYLNYRKLSINYKKINFINFSINRGENNFDI